PAALRAHLFPYTTLFRSLGGLAVNTRGRIGGAALALVLGLSPVAVAQDAGPKDVRKIYTRNVLFKLPVQIDEKERAELTGLKLRSEEHTSELQSRFDLVC